MLSTPMLAPFHYGFAQRGVYEVLLLSVPAGLLGSWIVLRRLSFFTHAVGTATFPGLVLADGLGFAPFLGAAATALVFAAGVERASRRRVAGYDSLTALALAATLGIGVVLASDVFHSGSNVETLLFGSLLLIGDRELALAAAAAAATLVLTALLRRRWLATGFDPEHARALGLRSPLPDAILLALVALTATVSVSAVGALLVTALFVVPAATVRVLTTRLRPLQIGSVALAAADGVAGIWLSVEWNVPPGAAIAVLAGACFAVAALIRASPARRALVLAALALLAAGCTASPSSKGIRIVATTTQVGDWARAVGGGRVDVHQILRPNTDPHDYEPRPADVEATSGAAAVFENGDKLDRWMAKIADLAGGHPTVVVLGDAVPIRRGSDPHWWHDPRNAIAAVEQVRSTLSRLDRRDAGAFRGNAAAYVRRLRALDRRIAACIATIPPARRKLVTDHDAFGYFAARYGLEVVGAVIPSQTTQAQPSARDVARLVALIRREHVQAIFPESSLSPRLARQIARETGARADYTLYGDTLGPDGSAGATYLGMEAANADAITRGLTGGKRSCPSP
jgi:ABC-type Zn uptake system ZnuABC Zn-binding protein ZnuA/ABC-type Mn2+/Zn2+ transport system permease subunit